MRRLLITAMCASLGAAAGCARSDSAEAASAYRLSRVAEDPAGGGDSAISPDGSAFVTSLKRNGNWDLWTFDLRTRTWKAHATDRADDFEGQWSPDGRQIVFTSTRTGNKDVFLLTLADGSVRQLTDDPEDDEYPVFSPDGTQVVYTGGAWGRRDFFLLDLATGRRRAIRNDPGMAGACSFHPSGTSVVCHSYDSGTGNVSLYPLDGAPALRLTNGRFWDYKPTVSPDGRWLAFSRSHDGASQIWAMPFPAGAAFPLTDGGGDDRWPTWSRDNKLLFHRLVDRGLALRLYDRATGATREIAGADEAPGYAAFHPDGRRIVYASAPEGKEELRVIDMATGRIVRVPTGGHEAAFPRWSAEGDRLAFVIRMGDRWEVATAAADGGGLRVWTDGLPNVRSMRGPLDWSPDGRHIVFHASSRPFEADLYQVDLRDGRVQNLTNDRWFSEAPAFTPDGRAVTFMSTRGGGWTWGLFRLLLADRRVETFAGPDYEEKNFPRAGRDGSTVWSAYRDDGREYLVERSRTGDVRVLTQAGGGARWPSYSPDGDSILFTVIDRKVQYWVAEHVTAAGSPLAARRIQTSAVAPAADAVPGVRSAALGASPVQMHHR